MDAATRRASGLRGLVLAGEAGVGKTRLAREALARARQRGAVTRWAAATASARSLPLGAFAGVLGDVGGDPNQVLRKAGDALLGGGGRAGVVLVVDDAHLLDDLSALLVHQIALEAAATIVITVRAGELAPDAVTALWKDGHLDRLEVQPLSEVETATLLEAVLGGPVDSAAAGRLWQLTRGNALYLRQLVDGEIDAGRLNRVHGVWHWADNPTLSPGLAELVTARIGALPEQVRDVVDVLALGEPLGVTMLGRLTDPLAVEHAEGRELVSVEKDGRRLQARLAHPLYGEVRRAGLGEVRARRLRGQIASALAAAGGRRADDTLRRATLAIESDLELDRQLLTEAAERAAFLVDFPLAERLGRAAVAAGGGFAAQAIVAFAVSWTGTADAADTEVKLMGQMASSDAEFVRATVLRASHLSWVASRPADAEAVLAAAAARVDAAAERQPLVAMRAMLDSQRGRPADAARSAATVLAAPDADARSVVTACCALTAALATTGRADEIAPVVARGLDTAKRSATELAMFLAPLLVFPENGQRLAGYLDDAVDAARACREHIKNMTFGAAIGAFVVGDAELAHGRLESARRWLREARAGMEPFADAGGWRYAVLIALTKASAAAGDIDAARAARANLEQHRHPAMVFLEPEELLARAWVSAAEGSVSEAAAQAREAAELAARFGQLAHEVLALQTAVCFGDRTVAGRLAELATQVDGPRAPTAAAHAAALAADDADGLIAASERLEQMGDLLAAADAAAQAAVSCSDHGRTASTRSAAARAYRLAEACEGARTPALAAAARPLPLTAREREIVTLAAHGLSNQEIAGRLTVSIRTVEGHLYRASSKLGATRRTELAALVGGVTSA